MADSAFRVVVWSTGGIGTIAVRAVSENPDTDLVGDWVHSPEKVGRDAGEIVGMGPIGVTATDDADELIASPWTTCRCCPIRARSPFNGGPACG